MENNELIKNFERAREYIRQFYIYGFRSRTEMKLNSPRSYDNERRRIENWLGQYTSFRRIDGNKQMFINMNSRKISHNPLYNAFKAKSFTDNDITLHFYILDCLEQGTELSLTELLDMIEERYQSQFPFQEENVLDISTLRKKLKEYKALGILKIRKRAKEYVYSKNSDNLQLDSWKHALNYYSETMPLGVIGSFVLDRLPKHDSIFKFKHHYLIHSLDSEASHD